MIAIVVASLVLFSGLIRKAMPTQIDHLSISQLRCRYRSLIALKLGTIALDQSRNQATMLLVIGQHHLDFDLGNYFILPSIIEIVRLTYCL